MANGPITALMEKLPKPTPKGPAPAQGAGTREGSRQHPTANLARPSVVVAQLRATILDTCDRIYQRDHTRFAKLIVWVHSARKRRYEDRYILQALTILDKRESEGKPIADWWPWCDRAISYIRTRDKQGESQQYKKADFSSARAIMKELFKNL